MWEDDVRSGGEESPAPEPKSGDAGKGGAGKEPQPKEDKDSIRLSRSDYDTMREELAELKFWKNSQAAREDDEPEQPKTKREEPEDEDDLEALLKEDPEKFTDEFSAEGLKSLVKRGFITEKRAKRLLGDIAERVISERLETLVDGKINKAQRAMLADAEILQKYPDLQKADSPLAQRTKEIYREIMTEDRSTPKATALKLAARTAAAELKETRESREERIARQSGGRDGGRSGGYDGGDDDDDLTPVQKRILAGFNADGGITVSEEAYRKRAKAGVNVSSKGGYKPGSMTW